MSTGLFDNKLDAILFALEDIEEGEVIKLCRQEESKPCGDSNTCDMCAIITYRKGMTAGDILQMARKHRA